MADFTSNIVTHPYDDTGLLPENHIVGELHDLPSRNVRAIRPQFGAFYADSFNMWDANGVPVPKEKLQFCLYSELISERLNRTIVGAVLLKDVSIPSPVAIEYHCVGGPWGVSNELIITLFNKLQADDRPIAFGDIIGFPPEGVKPAHHLQDIGDLYGAEYFVAAMDRLANAFMLGDKASHDELYRAILRTTEGVDIKIEALNQSLRIYIDQKIAGVGQQIVQINNRIDTLNGGIDDDLAGIEQSLNQLNADLKNRINDVAVNLAQHMATDNAHRVTPGLIGTYTAGQIDQKIAGAGQDLSNYVKKNTAEDLSLSISNGQLVAFANGAWHVVWPAQWS